MPPSGLLPVDYVGRDPTLLSGVLPSGVSIRPNCTLSAIVAVDYPRLNSRSLPVN
jgi:hypothetical protein